MSPENIDALTRRLDYIIKDIDEVKALAKETNGRIKELEIWRARVQGATASAKVAWMVAGGAVTAAIVEVFIRN